MKWWWMLTGTMFSIGALPWLLAATGVDGAYLFAFICHQLPERTLHLHGDAMALCSRCAGVHLGLSIGAVAAAFTQAAGSTRVHGWLLKYGRPLVIAAIALNICDWTCSVWLPLSHVSRVAVGAMFGAFATSFMLASLAGVRARRPRTLVSSRA